MSYSFDGINDDIFYSALAALDNMATFTVIGWMNPTGYGENNRGRIIEKGNGASLTSGWAFFLTNAGTRQIQFSVAWNAGVNPVSKRSVTAYTDNVWNGVAATYDGGATGATAINLYAGLTGSPLASASTTNGSGSRDNDSGNVIRIGNTPSNDRTFAGLLAYQQVFPGVILTGAQIVAALLRPGFRPAGLFNPLHAGAQDYSGNGATVTISGATFNESMPPTLPPWGVDIGAWFDSYHAPTPPVVTPNNSKLLRMR